MDIPDEDEIRGICTDQSFRRGQAYYRRGHVTDLIVDDNEIRATVQGTHAYRITIQFTDEHFRTTCTCPYDFGGDCKHIVATLLAARDGNDESGSKSCIVEQGSHRVADIEALLADTPPADLRQFLQDVLVEEQHLRERFLAFAGAESAKTVQDYKADINREFDAAAGRHGFVDAHTVPNFVEYHALAETHREGGHVEAATAVYRAIAEAIHENLHRVDDSSGHYGEEIGRALTEYADAVLEADLTHEQKRPHIEYLCRAFVADEDGAPGDQYEEALWHICTSRQDVEYWRELLESSIPGIPPEADPRPHRQNDPDRAGPAVDERTEAILFTSDFTAGPLAIEDFVGAALDIEHLAVGPLEIQDFVGDAFDELIVDEPTTIEAHTITGLGDTTGEARSSFRTRHLLSTYLALLDELDADAQRMAVLERTYLERPGFCSAYAKRLIEDGDHDRAIQVLEDGIETYPRSARLLRLATDLYRGRDPNQYRETLERLFLEHRDWDAYKELSQACDAHEWAGRYADWEREFRETDPVRLIELYLRADDLDAAFEMVTTSEQLAWFQRYRDQLGDVDPEAYFERYRELLTPFAAGKTGRRHYRTIADHLEHMRGLVAEERFEAYVERLKDTHSNRPAFLDELRTAGF